MEIVFDAILDQMRTEFRTIERTESATLTRLDRFFETAYRLFAASPGRFSRDVRRYYPSS